jgi:hypothetical protein
MMGDYQWDWVNKGDIVMLPGDWRHHAAPNESYVVRNKADDSILCFTSRYRGGYERALAIAAAMNRNDDDH